MSGTTPRSFLPSISDHNLFLYQAQASSRPFHCWHLFRLNVSIRSSPHHQRTAIRSFSSPSETIASIDREKLCRAVDEGRRDEGRDGKRSRSRLLLSSIPYRLPVSQSRSRPHLLPASHIGFSANHRWKLLKDLSWMKHGKRAWREHGGVEGEHEGAWWSRERVQRSMREQWKSKCEQRESRCTKQSIAREQSGDEWVNIRSRVASSSGLLYIYIYIYFGSVSPWGGVSSGFYALWIKGRNSRMFRRPPREPRIRRKFTHTQKILGIFLRRFLHRYPPARSRVMLFWGESEYTLIPGFLVLFSCFQLHFLYV